MIMEIAVDKIGLVMESVMIKTILPHVTILMEVIVSLVSKKAQVIFVSLSSSISDLNSDDIYFLCEIHLNSFLNFFYSSFSGDFFPTYEYDYYY